MSDLNTAPAWVRRVHAYQRATFGSGNGRIERNLTILQLDRLDVVLIGSSGRLRFSWMARLYMWWRRVIGRAQ